MPERASVIYSSVSREERVYVTECVYKIKDVRIYTYFLQQTKINREMYKHASCTL